MTKRKSELSARAARVAKNVKHTRTIDYSDIPELSDNQLKSMKRVGRPTIGENVRHLIAIRIDPQVLMQLQNEAKKQGKGYQSLINEILAKHTKRSA
jgi:uncharacterized protein (DUF4415 family)